MSDIHLTVELNATSESFILNAGIGQGGLAKACRQPSAQVPNQATISAAIAT